MSTTTHTRPAFALSATPTCACGCAPCACQPGEDCGCGCGGCAEASTTDHRFDAVVARPMATTSPMARWFTRDPAVDPALAGATLAA